jgi:hypothetical protein
MNQNHDQNNTGDHPFCVKIYSYKFHYNYCMCVVPGTRVLRFFIPVYLYPYNKIFYKKLKVLQLTLDGRPDNFAGLIGINSFHNTTRFVPFQNWDGHFMVFAQTFRQCFFGVVSYCRNKQHHHFLSMSWASQGHK